MSDELKIGVITMVYNEEKILPYFLKHYSYADEIHVLLESDTNDRSLEILDSAGNVWVKGIHIEGGIVDEEKVRMVNEEIEEMADEFDWIYVLDPDEFIYPDNHEPPREFLARQRANIVYAHMWQVYRHWSERDLDPDKFPIGQRQHGDPDLYNQTEHKYRDKNANSIKPSVIRAGAGIKLLPGNHLFAGQTTVSEEIYRGAHWQMADYEIAIDRRLARKNRMSKRNLELRHGFQHHHITAEIIAQECIDHRADPKLPIFDIPNLNFLKYVSLEINDQCPLTNIHPECPRNHDRFANLPDYGTTTVEEMIDFVNTCRRHGFGGLITLHNYNEPLCTRDIAMQIIDEFPYQVSLWTSGLLLDPDRDSSLIRTCHDVMITRYPEVKLKDFSRFINVKTQTYPLDNRAGDECNTKPTLITCERANWEIILNIKGFLNPCCGDWKGEISLGNIKVDGPEVLLHRWAQWRKGMLKIMPWDTPEKQAKLSPACRKCLSRGTNIPMAGR